MFIQVVLFFVMSFLFVNGHRKNIVNTSVKFFSYANILIFAYKPNYSHSTM